MAALDELEKRLRSLEAESRIRWLTARYCSALDERDFDSFESLFAPTAELVGTRVTAHGPAAIRQGVLNIVNKWTGPTIHFIGNRSVELDPEDEKRATGLLYCRAEHEFGDRWPVQMLRYRDEYVFHEGQWLFQVREAQTWYAADMLERPVGPDKVRWGDGCDYSSALPEAWPTYRQYWAAKERESV